MNEALRDLLYFIGALVVLFFIWVFTGGPERYISQKGPYLEPPAPLGSGDAYGIDPTLKYLPAEPGAIRPQSPTPRSEPVDPITGAPRPSYSLVPVPVPPSGEVVYSTQSAYRVQIFRGQSEENGAALKEHLVIQNRSATPLLLTGTSLEDGKGTKIILGGASELPIAGQPTQEVPVTLQSGAYAIIETGRSPIGISFRVNKCTGYFGQFLSFSPKLPRECPSAAYEAPAQIQNSCPIYLGSIPKCATVYHGSPIAPADATAECKVFAQTELSYNSCTARHAHESGFKNNEWRIYLGLDAPVWQNSSEIRLYAPDKTLLGVVR